MKAVLFSESRLTYVAMALVLVLAGCGEPAAQSSSASSTSSTVSTTIAATVSGCDAGDHADADAPCVISNVEQLQAIASNPRGHYVLGADIDASATSGWNDGKGFAPYYEFHGSIDGDGFTISNLFIDRPDNRWTGLIGSVMESGSVTDLRLTGAQLTGGPSSGILAGRVRGSVSNVHVDGVIQGEEWVGGLIGSLAETGSLSGSSMTDGSVTASSARAGGLVGNLDGTISNSFSLVPVAASTEVGGLAGRSSGTVENSYSIVGSPETPEQILHREHSGSNVGGLIGVIEARAIITDSYTVSFESSQLLNFTGFVGFRLVGHDWGDAEGVTSSYAGTDQPPRSDFDRSLDALKQAATFEGWDFDDTWSIAEGEDYPDLRDNPR